MVSDDLGHLADAILAAATRADAPTPAEMGKWAAQLLDAANTVSTLETLPLEVTLSLLDAIPEAWLARVAAGAGP